MLSPLILELLHFGAHILPFDLGLDDLCVRFIVNLPKEELESVERICFQVEEAQWFYEDFIRPLDPQLPSLNLRQFCLLIFQHCPLLSGFSPYHHSAAFSEFLAYKTRVPVRGAIMLNEAMDQVVLVKGWKKGANWSFPRGKINKDEKDLDCAVREVYEETGFDIKAAGLVAAEEDAKYIEVTMREQHMRLYVFRNVPMDTCFEPRTRKEISKIEWYKLSELPTMKKKQLHQENRGEDLAKNANKFYMVAPFLVPLKKWIAQQKKQDAMKSVSTNGNITSTNPEATALAKATQVTDQSAEPLPLDDMSRLLANLRNSSRKAIISVPPQLPDPAQTAKDASIQLKNLLQVPMKSFHDINGISNNQTAADNRPTSQAEIDHMKRNDESAKANAMLASLRAAGTVNPNRPLYNDLPHTPFEQITGTPPIPGSPRHNAPSIKHRPTAAAPPRFPYSPDQVGLKQSEQKVDWSQNGQPSNPINERYISNFPRQRPDAPHSLQTSLYNSTKANHLPLAPYQRTGDPQFAQAPKQPADFTSSIPPASNLPLPKLTNHSSLLLGIFKSGDMARTTFNSSTTDGKSAAEEGNIKLELQEPSVAATTDKVGNSRKTPHVRSPEKEALLNLFRASMSTPVPTQSTPTTLEPPSTPIELSAFPSPSHSRATSQITQERLIPLPKAIVNGKTSMKKRPEPVSGTKPSRKAPVSATVTGPLNVPQFDRISKASNSPISINVPPQRAEVLKEHQVPPMMILARPGSKHNSLKAESAKPMSENIRPRGQSSGSPSTLQNSKQAVATPKPFSPQILRRPPQEQVPKRHPHVPPTPLHIATKENIALDGPTTFESPAQDHRNSLLSIFNRPSPGPSPLTPTYKSFVSPLSEQPMRSENVVPFPLDTPRSRMGSLGDGFGTTRDGKSGGRQTPRTDPADKLALLNFLDSVVKNG